MGKLPFTTAHTFKLSGHKAKGGDEKVKFCITEKALWLIFMIIIALKLLK